MDTTLLCTKCNIRKPIAEFSPARVRLIQEKGWRGAPCRACERDRERKWRKNSHFLTQRPDMKERECGRCKAMKKQEDFAPSKWASKESAWCRECNRVYYKQRRSELPGHYSNMLLRKRRERAQELRELKKGLGCSQCGESHPACLEFHHRDGEQKDKNISQMVARGYSVRRIQDEMKKCDVLCSNCHRKLHYDNGDVTMKKPDAVIIPRKHPTRVTTLTLPKEK